MKQRRLFAFAILAALLILCSFAGCDITETADASSAAEHSEAQAAVSKPADELPGADDYIRSLAKSAGEQLLSSGMSEREKVRAAYVWAVESIYFAQPVGIDSWQLYASAGVKPGFLEAHALSPLLYGVGSCEDFAAALTLVLRAMGFEARYVYGMVISAQGSFVDHAWTMVRLGSEWYHLDSQLEQNITKDGALKFSYFLKGDDYMMSDHRWGESLAAYLGGALSEDERAVIERDAPPPCVQSAAAEPPAHVELPARPGADLMSGIASARSEYERAHGRLPAFTMPEPPVDLQKFSGEQLQ